jgi:molecular chaperone GrpE
MDKHRTKPQSSEPVEDGALEREGGATPQPAVDPAGGAQPDAGAEEDAGDAIVSATARDAALDREREKYLRLAAEFDNYRKRAVRDRQEAGWRAQSDLVLGLLEALDDIMRFAHLDPATVDAATVVEGVALVERKITKALSGHGLEILNPLDQLFDPAFHEAVGTEAALSREDDHLIAKVYQPGYVFRGQLLRPARVVVKQWLG